MSDANAPVTAPVTAPVEPAAPPTFAELLGVEGAVDRVEMDGIATAVVPAARFAEAAQVLRDRLGYIRFVDLSVVDLVETGRADRFEVYVMVYSMEKKSHARIKAYTSGSLPSITSLFAGAHNYEREGWDLFGITFVGHPSLTRILMPDGWVGHPMQRDAENPMEPVDFTVTRELYNT